MNMISILFPPPKPNLQKLKVKLQNLLGPNDMDNRNNGVKSKSVVIPIVKSSGILDTFSLSFVGNLNFSNAIQGLQKIVEGLASCEFSGPIQFPVMGSAVDLQTITMGPAYKVSLGTS